MQLFFFIRKLYLYKNKNDGTVVYMVVGAETTYILKMGKCKQAIDEGTKTKCVKTADYGVPGGGRDYCAKHKLEGMVIPARKTQRDPCKHSDHSKTGYTRSSFGWPGDAIPTYCLHHKLEGMHNVVLKNMCVCGKSKTFGDPGTKIKECCSTCKKIGMVDLVSNLCTRVPCEKNAVFGNENDAKASRCSDHKEVGMIDVKNAKCVECVRVGADKPVQPKFGPYGMRLFCKKHSMCDVSNHATYIEDRKKTKCVYKFNDDPAVKTLRDDFCNAKSGCDVRPMYGYQPKKPITCNLHKLADMVDVINARCIGCGVTVVNSTTNKNKLCSQCDSNKVDYAKNEHLIRELMLKMGGHAFRQKVTIGNQRTKYYKPDLYFENETKIIILEVDQTQHKDHYPHYEKDEERMDNIQKLVSKPCAFIRFNPDSFTIRDFRFTEMTYSMQARALLACNVMDGLLSEQISDDEPPIGVIRLFYDERNPVHVTKIITGSAGTYAYADATARAVARGGAISYRAVAEAQPSMSFASTSVADGDCGDSMTDTTTDATNNSDELFDEGLLVS